MATVAESLSAASPIAASIFDGLEVLSTGQTVEFYEYHRYVLPIDGYVFWVRGAAFRATGSLHREVARRQSEDETAAVNRIWFTTRDDVTRFNRLGPSKLLVGSSEGIRFAFSERGPLYKEADVFHFGGISVYPALASQLIDDPAWITSQPIVSNSLPSWLALAAYEPVWLAPHNPAITLFPSYLVPDNEFPPYGAVHIEPAATRAIQGFPIFDKNTTHEQLAADRVSVTLYGLTNQQALDWQDLVTQYSRDTDNFGFMASPAMRDDKRTQPEISAIAMKKTITFDVSYYQSRQNNIAWQLIETATVTTTTANP